MENTHTAHDAKTPDASNPGARTAKVFPVTASGPSGASNSPNGVHVGNWSVGLHDCSDCVPNCLMSTLCPCIALAQIYARLGVLSYRVSVVLIVVGFVGGTIYCTKDEASKGKDIIPALLAGFRDTVILAEFLIVSPLVVFIRMHVRDRFMIPGSCREDCKVASSCMWCAIAQIASHTRSYKPGDCSFKGPDVLPAYNG